jgi:glycerol uptake facilitator-like aquaporin
VVAGLAIISLTTIFFPVSGAHINPAISLATSLIRRVTPIRAIGHVVAQCGGAIAGASVVLGLYGASDHFPTVTVTNFGLEFLLSFMIVLVYLRVTDYADQHDSALCIGISYMAALAAYRGALNPAFALGQAFVSNKFDNHWIFWIGPLLGGCCAALSHEYIFNDQKDTELSLANFIGESSESTFKDCDKEVHMKAKTKNSCRANQPEALFSETDSVFDDHIHHQSQESPQLPGN